MKPLSTVVGQGLSHSFADFHNQVLKLAERLTDEQFWRRPHPYGNSFGNLVLHLTGNLNYYIGSQIAGTAYLRDREAEFAERTEGDRAETLDGLQQAVATVIESLARQSEDDWGLAFSAQGVQVDNRFSMYLRCCAHFHHHLGQMIYLVKAWEHLK